MNERLLRWVKCPNCETPQTVQSSILTCSCGAYSGWADGAHWFVGERKHHEKSGFAIDTPYLVVEYI